jgi:hypothetical protein
VLELAGDALGRGERVTVERSVRNTDRAIGTLLSGELVRRLGPDALADGALTLQLSGTAGQSLGAWGIRGLVLDLQGQANDYAGKGLSGARIVVRPPAGAGYEPRSSIAVGNTTLYGATSGELFVRGRAGERFAVRNSGAIAVVEGVGRHGCEYMTGGLVAVRWSRGVLATARGLLKNSFAAVEWRWGHMLYVQFVVLILALLPAVAALAAPLPWLRLLALVPVVLALGLHAGTARSLAGGSGLEGVAYVLADLALVAVGLWSAASATLAGGIEWRGTRYRLESLRDGCVRERDWPVSSAVGWD